MTAFGRSGRAGVPCPQVLALHDLVMAAYRIGNELGRHLIVADAHDEEQLSFAQYVQSSP